MAALPMDTPTDPERNPLQDWSRVEKPQPRKIQRPNRPDKGLDVPNRKTRRAGISQKTGLPKKSTRIQRKPLEHRRRRGR